ncbi:MAG: cytochrome c oxidase subunit II [Thermoanaerobaculia bacterium]
MLLISFPLFPARASTIAGSVDALFFFLIGVTVFFSTLIFLCIAYLAIKYRRRSDDEVPAEIHGSLPLEIVWTAIPLGIVAVMFFWGAKLFLSEMRAPANAMPVYVVGKQWMWKVQHPEGKSEINELHVPLGVPVRLILTSEDVIHDFAVPAFRIKRDVLPGRYTSEWFQATKTGEFHLFCNQYCGTQHSAMIGRVVVMEPSDFQSWLASDPRTPTMAASGRKLYASLNCATCHNDRLRAPSLDGSFGTIVDLQGGQTAREDEAYVRESLLNPRAKIVRGYPPVMPTYQGQLNETEILQLIAYMQSLGGGEPRAAGAKGETVP